MTISLGQYKLEMKHINPNADEFFGFTDDTRHLQADREVMASSVTRKHNIDPLFMTVENSQTEDGYVYTVTVRGFDSPEHAEAYLTDITNATFWQNQIFEWNKEHGVATMTRLLDGDGNLVKVLHDNRGIVVQGSGPGSWGLYTPA